MKAAYTGHEVLTFMDYLDLGTGRTLTAEPGGVYDVAPAGGRNVPDLPPGFTKVTGTKTSKPAGAAGQSAPEVPEHQNLAPGGPKKGGVWRSPSE